MTRQLQRLTTMYVDVEDRFRIAGEIGAPASAEQAPGAGEPQPSEPGAGESQPSEPGAEGPETVVIWVTQRLLLRLVPALSQWLERGAVTQGGQAQSLTEHDPDSARREVMQHFAQQAARSEYQSEPPVVTADSAPAWLAVAVDVSWSAEAMSLTFRSAAEDRVNLTLAAQPLRQWMGILHEGWRRAQWPAQIWPTWMFEVASDPGRSQTPAVLH